MMADQLHCPCRAASLSCQASSNGRVMLLHKERASPASRPVLPDPLQQPRRQGPYEHHRDSVPQSQGTIPPDGLLPIPLHSLAHVVQQGCSQQVWRGVPPKLQRVQHTQRVPAVVRGHRLKQAVRLRAQKVANLDITRFLRLEPGTLSSQYKGLDPSACRADKLPNTVNDRHVLIAQKQAQQRLHGRSHDPAQQVEAGEPAKG